MTKMLKKKVGKLELEVIRLLEKTSKPVERSKIYKDIARKFGRSRRTSSSPRFYTYIEPVFYASISRCVGKLFVNGYLECDFTKNNWGKKTVQNMKLTDKGRELLFLKKTS